MKCPKCGTKCIQKQCIPDMFNGEWVNSCPKCKWNDFY